MADNNVGNLNLGITSNITKSINSINKLTSSLITANVELAKMSILSQSSPVTININKIGKSVGSLNTQAKLATKSIQTMSGTLGSLKNILLFNLGFGSLQQGINTVTGWFRDGFAEASNFVENFNLFNVSMAGSTEEAMKYQNLLNRSMGINMSQSMRYQGVFKNLANSLGITNDASDILSRNLTNLTYDLASLHNRNFDTTFSKLQSGIVGQTKPLRDLGIDVTQQTLQPLLYEMGINKYVTELTQAEKVLLRYIAIIKQSSSAHGDFAKTIETPANQIRIFNDQIKELQRWFGTMFIGTIGAVLPYINGFIMALKEIFKWVSMLFGFKTSDWDFFVSQSKGAEDFNGVIDDTVESTKELKKSLMGFDEINNLGSQSSGDNTPNIGLSDTYYQLLGNLTEYDNLMEGVKTKASSISQSILEWFGFSTGINEETNEMFLTYEGGNPMVDELVKLYEKLEGVFEIIGKFLKDNGIGFDDFIRVAEGFILFLIAKGAIVLFSNLANPLNLLAIAIALIVLNSDKLSSFWGGLSEGAKIALEITGAIVGIAVAIMILDVALSKGLSAIGVVGALTAITGAMIGLSSIAGLSISVSDLIQSSATVDNSGVTRNANGSGRIIQHANGGFPTSGEMFIARENGPEMVGSIGGKSSVANNEQIVEAVSQGVAIAVSDVMGNGSSEKNIYLVMDSDTLGRATIKAINRVQKTTNLVLEV